MTVYEDAHKRLILCPYIGIIGIYNKRELFIMLSGNQLLTTVQSLPDADIKELARTCGYISTRKDGTQKLNFTDFYMALLSAKGDLY